MTPAIAGLRPRLSACRGVLVDSNILLDIATNDPSWSGWFERALAECAEQTALIINPVVYAEVSIGYTTIEALDAALPSTVYQREALPLGSRFPGREVLPAVPPPRRGAARASAGFLHWGARRHRTACPAHARS